MTLCRKPAKNLHATGLVDLVVALVLRVWFLTLMAFMLLFSSLGMETMQTPVMMSKLKAAEPTMVPGPKGPALKLCD